MKSQFYFKTILVFIIIVVCFSGLLAQESTNKRNQKNFDQKNIVFLRVDSHIEQRGEGGNLYSNPEISIGYDRKVFGVGKNHFFAGIRTGLYWETALTARNYDNTYSHPFVGLYPSYMFAPIKMFKLQVSGVWDVIFETHDDIDDFWWWYFGLEPSAQFYPVDQLYISFGATIGQFPWFEPQVTMIKAFFKVGFCF